MYFSTFKNRCRHSHTSSTFSQKLFVSIYCAMWGSLWKLDYFDPKIHCSFVPLEKWSTFSTEMLVTAHSLSLWNRKMSFKLQTSFFNLQYNIFLKCGSNVRIAWEIKSVISLFLRCIPKCTVYLRDNPRFSFLFNYNILELWIRKAENTRVLSTQLCNHYVWSSSLSPHSVSVVWNNYLRFFLMSNTSQFEKHGFLLFILRIVPPRVYWMAIMQ